MKQIITLFLLLICVVSFSQLAPPQAFNYSAVARNAQNQPIANQTVGVQLSILKSSTVGAIQYQENHFTTTDQFGLFNLTVGTGAIQQGSFTGINWGNDNYYLRVGLDAQGGNNFQLMGTTQLLSVPYALYAGNVVNSNDNDTSATNELQTLSISNDTLLLSKGGGFVKLSSNSNVGKSHIVLAGDITDAQAATLIQQDFGTSTQFVWILNTTQLTTATFSGVADLVEIRIDNNKLLQSLSFNDVKNVFSTISLPNSNPSLTQLLFPNLEKVYGYTSIKGSNIGQLSFPSLKSIVSSMSIECPLLSQLTFPVLENSLSLYLEDCAITTLNFPKLTSGHAIARDCSALSAFSAPLLSFGTVVLDNTALSSLNLPIFSRGSVSIASAPISSINLSAIDSGSVGIRNTSITTISLPVFRKGGLNFDGQSITSIQVPVLEELQYQTNITNTSITSLSMPQLKTVLSENAYPLRSDVYLTGNKLTSAGINSFLAKLVSLNPLPASNTAFDIRSQNPIAGPTGQGLIDKQTLQNNGIVVLTN